MFISLSKQHIKSLRDFISIQGLTQKEAALKFDISLPTLSRILNGHITVIQEENYKKICKQYPEWEKNSNLLSELQKDRNYIKQAFEILNPTSPQISQTPPAPLQQIELEILTNNDFDITLSPLELKQTMTFLNSDLWKTILQKGASEITIGALLKIMGKAGIFKQDKNNPVTQFIWKKYQDKTTTPTE